MSHFYLNWKESIQNSGEWFIKKNFKLKKNEFVMRDAIEKGAIESKFKGNLG